MGERGDPSNPIEGRPKQRRRKEGCGPEAVDIDAALSPFRARWCVCMYV